MHKVKVGVRASILLAASSLIPQAVLAHEHGDCGDDDAVAGVEVRSEAGRRLKWEHPKRDKTRPPVAVQILGFNDFHGQLSAGRRVANRPVGGAAVLASYLKSEQAAFAGTSFIVHAGDHVGASPAASALLQDEPAMTFLNMLGNEHCVGERKHGKHDGKCNMIGTLGNHEFDEGFDELERLLEGGLHENGPFLDDDYAGVSFPYVSANVVRESNGKPILPPYVIRKAGKAKIAFIGAVLRQTPSIVTPSGVAGLRFLDEADSINKYIPEIRRMGVEAIVVLIHQGGNQASYTGATVAGGTINGTEINAIVSRLHGAVDVVVSGHAHSFSNALLPSTGDQPVLVVQAFSASTAYDDIELVIDPVTRDVVQKSASIVTTWGDAGPGLTPDTQVAALVSQAEAAVAPLVSEVIAETSGPLTRTANTAGESALGNLIADAQRAAMGTDFAFMNPGGIRADLDAGLVTWGELFTVQPFGNTLVRLNMTGAQLYALLEQQWAGQTFPRIMQISGLTYTWDANLPVGSRVVDVRQGGVSLSPTAVYSVTCNSFIAAGGDNFTLFLQGTNQVGGPIDLDALIAHLESLAQPFTATVEGRIQRLN